MSAREVRAEGRSSPRSPARLIGLAVPVVVGVAIFVAFHTWPWFHSQVLESVSRRPTPFTEVYFSAPANLPKHLDLDQPSRFSFVIVNHDEGAVDYVADVVLHGPRGAVPLAADHVRLLSGRSSEQVVQFRPDQRDSAYVVTVQLRGRAETIRFSATS